jgi:multidrug efflux pump subunit AcrA (membrane-fusion protein)
MKMEKRMVFLVLVMIMAVILGCTPIQTPPATTAPGIDSDAITPVLPQPVASTPPVTGAVVAQEPSVEVSPQAEIYAKITLNEGELVKLVL